MNLRGLPQNIQDGLRNGSLVCVGNEILRKGDPRLAHLPPPKPKAKVAARELPSNPLGLDADHHERFPKDVDPRVIEAYTKAYAALLLPGKPLQSYNVFKWKHWTHHHKRRDQAKELVDNASWVIPLHGHIPTFQQTEPVKLTIVKFGGRCWDKGNYIAACKEVIDELVKRGLLKNDTLKWLDDQYYQIPGGVVPRVEILFHN